MRGRQAVKFAAVFLTVIFAASLSAGCASIRGGRTESAAGPGVVYKRAGDNADQIARFTARYSQGSQMLQAAEFLAANLPLSDALGMDADALAEHVDYAFLARESMPWGKAIPFDIFLRFVLPHRMSQEPVQPYRAAFYKALVPRLRGVRDVREAVRRVNVWVFEQAAFEPSSRQDQGPLTTIARGKGRCEEMGILLISALRSVGIPARPCSVPLWRHTEGNHLWIEVYDKGRWHFLGAGEIESDYDLAWFEPVLHTAPFIYTVAYGNSTIGLDGDGPAFPKKRSTLINRTAAYAPKGTVNMTVTSGGRRTEQIVAVQTYNFAAPRAVVLAGSEQDKAAEMDLGPGVYLATAAGELGRDYAFFEIAPGKTTAVALDLDRKRVFEGEAYMPFESDPDLRNLIQKDYNEARAAVKKRMNKIDKRRERKVAAVTAAARRSVKDCGETASKVLVGARLNAPEVARALMVVPEASRSTLLSLLAGMDAKDLASCRSGGLIENVLAARASRDRLARKGVLEYSDRIFERYVLPERVLYEPFSHWREEVAGHFRNAAEAASLENILSAVSRAVAALDPVSSGRLGSPLTPEAVFSSGFYRRERRDAQVAAAAALRSLGVPARALHDWAWIEYYDGGEWRPFYPWAKEESPEGLAAYYLDWPELAVRFILGDKPVDPEELLYARDVMICRFDERLGFVGLDAVRVHADKESDRLVLRFPPGEYWLSSGRRDKRDMPYVRMQRLMLAPGERLEMTRKLDVPLDPAIPEGTLRP